MRSYTLLGLHTPASYDTVGSNSHIWLKMFMLYNFLSMCVLFHFQIVAHCKQSFQMIDFCDGLCSFLNLLLDVCLL